MFPLMPIPGGRSDAEAPGPAERLTLEQALQLPPTISVARAAVLLGISRTAAYEAIHRKEIPSLSFGRRLVIPTAPLLAMLELHPQRQAATVRSSTPGCGLADCLGRLGQALLNGKMPPSSHPWPEEGG